jgi:DNA-binding protein
VKQQVRLRSALIAKFCLTLNSDEEVCPHFPLSTSSEAVEWGARQADRHPQPGDTPAAGPARGPGEPNHVYIGKKPVMSYAMSALIQLAQGGEVVLKARGMVISHAVDVAEIVAKRLGNNAYEVKGVKIGTERLGEGEAARNVSTIEIVLGRR